MGYWKNLFKAQELKDQKEWYHQEHECWADGCETVTQYPLAFCSTECWATVLEEE